MLVYILHATLSVHLTLGGGRENPEGEDICTCICVKSLQSCLILCDPMDSSPTCSSVHGILQARILEWVSMPFSGHSTHLSCLLSTCIGRWIFTIITAWEAQHMYQFSSVQSLSRVQRFATPWIAAHRPPCPSPTPCILMANLCWCMKEIKPIF